MADQPGRILACALDLYHEKGLPGLSMRILAEKLGISATAIYRHYKNKDEIIHKMIGEAVKSFAGYLFRALSGTTPQERFRLGAEAYLDFAMEQSKYYEVIFMSPQNLCDDPLPQSLRDESMATFQFLVDRVQECMDCGYLRKDDPHAVAMTIWANSHGLVSIYLAGKWPIGEADFRKLFLDSRLRLLRGLRAENQ
jgi:AcrR family transcriptional regulator